MGKLRIEEKSLVLPALYIIKRRGKATMSDLINDLTIVFNPSGEDADILSDRNDTKFSQKVRNLKSHRTTNGMEKYTNLTEGRIGIYTLTQLGENYLNSRITELDYLFSHKFSYDDTLRFTSKISQPEEKIIIYDENVSITEGALYESVFMNRIRSKKLRDAAIDYYKQHGGIRCRVCEFSFEDVYGELGHNYIEIHHERPICQYTEEGEDLVISEAVKYVKPICANCHRMIHKNPFVPLTIDELKNILR